MGKATRLRVYLLLVCPRGPAFLFKSSLDPILEGAAKMKGSFKRGTLTA